MISRVGVGVGVGVVRRLPGASSLSLFRPGLWFVLAFSPMPLSAQLGVGLVAEAEYIENPRRLPGYDEVELLSSATAAVQWQRATQRFETALQYNASRLEYRNDHLPDQSLVAGNSSLAWKIMPDVLDWQVSNMRSNQLIEISLPDTIENRQVIDYTSTGPVLTLPVGGVNLLNFSADFSLVNYEESGFLDHRRDTYNLGLTRLLGSRLTASLTSTYSQADFETIGDLSYKTYSLAAATDFTAELYTLSAEIGRYETERAGSRRSNPLLSLGVTYKLNSRLEFTVNYSESVQDLVSDMRGLNVAARPPQDPEFGFGDRLGNSNTASLYARTGSTFGATYTQPTRFTLAFSYSDDRRTGIDSPVEEQNERVSSTLRVPVSTRFSLSASAGISNLTASRFQGEQELSTLAVGASYQLGSRLSLIFSAIDSRQRAQGNGISFEGNNVSLGLAYTYSR